MSCDDSVNIPDIKYGLYENTSFYQTLAWENGDGTPFDLTGYTVTGELRDTKDPDVVLYTFDSTDSDTLEISAPSTGVMIMKVNNTNVSAFSFIKAEATFVFTNASEPDFPIPFFNLSLYFRDSTAS